MLERDGYELSDDRDRIDLALVHRRLATDAYWALGRPLDKMRAALAGAAHPRSLRERGLNRLLLVTKYAHAVYAPHGFVEVDPGRWMECDLRAVS